MSENERVLNRPLVIQQLEPAESVHCTENGQPVALGIDRPTDQAVLSCTKDEDTDLTLRVLTYVNGTYK